MKKLIFNEPPRPPMSERGFTMVEMLLNKVQVEKSIRDYVLKNAQSLSLAVLKKGDFRCLAIFNGFQPLPNGEPPIALFTPLEPLPDGVGCALSMISAPTLLTAGFNWEFCPETM